MPPAPSRRPVGAVFGQLYCSAAVLAIAALFVPLYVLGNTGPYQDFVSLSSDGYPPPLSDVVVSPRTAPYTLWLGIIRYGEGIAIVATLLILLTAALAVAAAARPQSFLLSGAVLVAAIIGTVLLVADPERPSAAASGPGLGMLWGAVLVLLVTSAVHLFRATTSPRE